MGNMFDDMANAYKAAFGDMRKAIGMHQPDPDLTIYEQLTPEHFDQIRKEKGLGGLLTYIRRMEARRHLGKRSR